MRILGLDPAATCGFAHSDGVRGIWMLAVNRDKHPGRRLERFRRHLFTIRRERGVDLLAAEDAGFGSKWENVQAMHNELRGVIKLVAAEWEIPIVLVQPSKLKKWLTGKGNAKKPDMIHWVGKRFGVRTDDDNVADAVAVMEFAKQEMGAVK